MSRNPNDTTTRKTGAKKAGSKKPKGGKGKKKADVVETPITISGGSINVDSKLNRKGGIGILNHKKCKIPDVSADKPWTMVRLDIYDKNGTKPPQSIPITDPDGWVEVIFQRPE